MEFQFNLLRDFKIPSLMYHTTTFNDKYNAAQCLNIIAKLINFLISLSLQSPPSITVTSSATPVTSNNNNNHVPPPTSITKSVNLTGPYAKKDRRQASSRFNVSKQNCEIESLSPLKGEWRLINSDWVSHTQKKNH